MYRTKLTTVFLCLSVLALQGCVSKSSTRPAIGSARISLQGGLSAEQQRRVDKNCYQGMPEKVSEDLGPTELVFREGYVLEHSSLDKIPLWVCEGVSQSQLTGNLDRDDAFAADPILKGPKAGPRDYARTGYDRGHQAPAGNQTVSVDLKKETFFMSNMAPQIPTMNRGMWRTLEELTRDWAKHFGQAFEWTGPVFYDPKEDDPATADGTIDVKTIGPANVAVPTHFYKIVVVQDAGQWKSIAFVVPNQKFSSPYDPSAYRQSIEWIEQHTGLNFMPNLPSGLSTPLESSISPMWP